MDAEAYADMLPWLVFVVMDRKLGLGVAWAAAGALTCSAGLVAWSYWRGRYALLPRIALGIFTVCLVSAVVFPAWNDQVSVPRAVVVVTLSLLAFGSLGFTPLSEAYTVPLVAPGIREDPRFRKVNVEITLAWGIGAFAVALASSTTALLPGRLAFTLLDWVTPLVLATVTMLWAARRWELFRLSVDSVRLDDRLGDASGHARGAAAGGLLGFPARRPLSIVGSPPLELAEASRDADPRGDGARDAAIRQLPVRNQSIGSAGGE